jgi:hypothetical protein
MAAVLEPSQQNDDSSTKPTNALTADEALEIAQQAILNLREYGHVSVSPMHPNTNCIAVFIYGANIEHGRMTWLKSS